MYPHRRYSTAPIDCPTSRENKRRVIMKARRMVVVWILIGALAHLARTQNHETGSALVKMLYDGKWPRQSDPRAVEQRTPLPARHSGLYDHSPIAEHDRHSGRVGSEVRQGLQRSA